MFLKIYLITLPVFFLIDMAWLSLMSKSFYSKHLGFLMKTNVNWIAAISFYILFVIGLVIFAILPAIQKHSWTQALFSGALLGFISYATYDLTNLATIKDWPLLITIVDMAWGAFLGGAVSSISYLIYTKI